MRRDQKRSLSAACCSTASGKISLRLVTQYETNCRDDLEVCGDRIVPVGISKVVCRRVLRFARMLPRSTSPPHGTSVASK
jgi:hypothetical protein